MKTHDEYTDEESTRMTSRITAYFKNPELLTPEVREKCRELFETVTEDGKLMSELAGKWPKQIPFDSSADPKRKAIVDWLAKTT